MNSIVKYTELLNRFPKFELSYETVSHKKVSNTDTIAIAISLGRKYFIWYTHKSGGVEPACYLIGLDKDKQICSVEQRIFQKSIPEKCKLGTIVYGTLYEHPQTIGDTTTPLKIFIAEDIYYHCGVNLSNLCFGDRIGFLREFVVATGAGSDGKSDIALPIMWHVESGKEHSPIIPPDLAIGYTAHHIQYREIYRVAPYINVAIPKKGAIPITIPAKISSATVAQKISATSVMNPIPRFDFTKPTYRFNTVFNVTADPQLDLYHLYAYGGPGNVQVYCGLACIQSLQTSMFMNKLFRRIRENDNLDLAEESEDEDDFENTDTHKYVNLDAIIPIECAFNNKHKKWMPVRLAKKDERVIHIEKLTSEHSTRDRRYPEQRPPTNQNKGNKSNPRHNTRGNVLSKHGKNVHN